MTSVRGAEWRRQNGASCALPALMIAWLGCAVALAENKEDDPTQEASRVVQIEPPAQPLNTPAPPSQFVVPDGEALWNTARKNVVSPASVHSSAFFDAAQLLGDGFVSAKDFNSEKYSQTPGGSELQILFSADEAKKEGKLVLLTHMRLTYYAGKEDSALPGKTKHKPAAPVTPGAPPVPNAPARSRKQQKAAPGVSALPMGGLASGGRLIIKAQLATIDIETNEGRASGEATIEVYETESATEPSAVIKGQGLRWRAWNDAALGSTEMALYTFSEKPGEPEPDVSCHYVTERPDGKSITEIQGQGLIFETGRLDRANTVYDEEGHIAGQSRVARNRAIFHRAIKMETTAGALKSVVPFQNAPNPRNPSGAKPAEPTRTALSCSGPAFLDLAWVPRQRGNADPAKSAILCCRCDFLNNVTMSSVPSDNQKPGAETTQMSCKNLCMQYPPGEMPSPSTFPEYAEAVGGVKMSGTGTLPNQGGAPQTQTPAPPAPFLVDCQRMYYDGLNDNMFLVGSSESPVHVKQDQFESSAREFNYRSKTGTLTMPSAGPKRMIIRGDALALPVQGTPGAAPPPSTGPKPEDVTVITWNGPMSREMKHLPVPSGADRLREILTLNGDVQIERAGSAMKMHGKQVQVIRTVGGPVEVLEGTGGIDVSMGELHAIGERVLVEQTSNESGEVLKDLTTVTGSRRAGTKATLFRGGTAVRADKFIIDNKAQTFRAFGGAVAVVKAATPAGPAKPKPQAAADAGSLLKGISLAQGGSIWMQCDGDFSQDGATRTVTITKNVLIRQPGMQLLADEVHLTFDDSVPNAGPGDALISGDPKSIECAGLVELSTDDQLVQCDKLFHEVKKSYTRLEMNDPLDDVRIYLWDDTAGTQILTAEHDLELDGDTGTFKPGGIMFKMPYRATAPAERGREHSPARGAKKEGAAVK